MRTPASITALTDIGRGFHWQGRWGGWGGGVGKVGEDAGWGGTMGDRVGRG